MQDFRKLGVWQKAHELVLAVYRETHVFEKTETYGLRSQMRRAAVLVPSHIADGCYRGSDDEYRRLLLMSLGSASELEYLLLLSKDLGYLDEKAYEELNALVVIVKKMLNSFIGKLGPRADLY